MIAPLVGDMLWACEPVYEHVIDSTKERLKDGQRCVVEVQTQQFDDFINKVICQQTRLKLGLINVSPERANEVESNVTQPERDQQMSVCDSLVWPDLQHVEGCRVQSRRLPWKTSSWLIARRSIPGVKVLFISDERLLGQDQRSVRLVVFLGGVRKRAVKSTMKAETHQLVDVVEASGLLRIGWADLHGALDRLDREVSAAAWCQNV